MGNNQNERTKLIQSERAPGRNFDLYSGRTESKFYADGFAGSLVGPSVSRVDFFQIQDTAQTSGEPSTLGEMHEIRERHISVIVPTAALIDFIVNSLGNLSANKDALADATHQQAESIRSALSSIGSKE